MEFFIALREPPDSQKIYLVENLIRIRSGRLCGNADERDGSDGGGGRGVQGKEVYGSGAEGLGDLFARPVRVREVLRTGEEVLVPVCARPTNAGIIAATGIIPHADCHTR